MVPLAVVSDVVHLLSVSLWLGGLVMLAAVVLPRRLPDELAVVVPRFSRLAFGAVIAILITGTFQGWREVRSKAALEAQGARPVGNTPAELSAVIAADTARWAKVIRDADIKLALDRPSSAMFAVT